LLEWSQDSQSPDGGPTLLKRCGGHYLDLIDFSNNNLSDKGANVIVDFLLEHGKPVKKLKLYGNQLTSCEAICRLLEDPACGLQKEVSLQELHLSHNQIDNAALEDLLNTIAQCKKPEPISPPLLIRLEKNKIAEEDACELAERLADQLQVCIILGSGTTGDADADVHVVL